MEKIQFKYITEEGKYKCKSFNLDIPEFKDYKTDFKGIPFVVKKDSQIMDFLDEMDKTYFMQENQIITILDYKPFVSKPKINKEVEILSIFKGLISTNHNKEQLYFDFVAVATKMKHSIKKLSIDKQINIILDGMVIGYKAQSTVLNGLSDFKESLEKDLNKLKTHDERLKYLKSGIGNSQLSE